MMVIEKKGLTEVCTWMGKAAHGRSGSVFFVAKANTSVMPIPNSEDERYQTLQVQLAE